MKPLARKAEETKYLAYIEKWKIGLKTGMRGKTAISAHIRRYLFEKFDFKCVMCHWDIVNKFTGNIPLEVNHIDGDYTNNQESNLELLCPNCHSLTDSYRSLNKGHGRPRN
jgi:Zn finger protein HypA/HybF involved in hydrogenase expression